MQPTPQGLRAALAGLAAPPRWWIAYSGGLDSHVLLHLCSRLRAEDLEFPHLQAVHVHHGLHSEADAWAEHCQRICQSLDIPLMTLHVHAAAAHGESPEEAARRARYGAISAAMATGEALLTAQHADDQAETLLLQMLRGAGLAGLAGMPAKAVFPPGFLLRPLLHHSRQDLLDYACRHRLHWIEDPSNANTAFDRNFIRHQVLPLLQSRWPSAGRSLSRSAGHCAEALQQLDSLAQDLYQVSVREDGQSLSIQRLVSLTLADQRLVLRQWLRQAGFRMPSAAVIGRILNEVLPAEADRMPVVAWREGEVRRYRDGLFLLPPATAFDGHAVLPWTGEDRLSLPQANGELQLTTPRPGRALDAAHWQKGPVEVRYRQGGERCRLAGRAGSHSLKHLFQEAGIPPWLRERAPLVYIAGELAAVADWWVAAPSAGSDFSLRWRPFIDRAHRCPPGISGRRRWRPG